MTTLIRRARSWLSRNPVQTGAVLATAAGIGEALQTGQATWRSVALWAIALITGGPAAIRSRWGTASQGGWFSNGAPPQ